MMKVAPTAVSGHWGRRGISLEVANRRRRGPIALAVALAVAALLPGAAAAQGTDVTCSLEFAPMRDGVRLATEVYRPAEPGRYPVVLTRSPYNRGVTSASNCDNADMRFFAAHGYVALNQDVRGTYRSEGRFRPMLQEARDGYDAVEWAASQPWSTSRVGMFGASYVGLTQWQAAISTPPHLAAIVPRVTASDYHDNWTYVNGVFDLWFAQSWNQLTFAPETFRRSLMAAGRPPAEIDQRVAEWYAQSASELLSDSVWQLPLSSFDAFRDKAPWYSQWLRHPQYDEFWARMDVERQYQNVKVPALNVGGWYDIFQVGTVRNFLGMRDKAGSASARSGSKLVMLSTAHAPAPSTPPTAVGDVDFGPNNTFDIDAASLRFYDHYLKSVDNGVDDEPAVSLFVMVPPDEGTTGSGFWVRGDTYPLPGTHTEHYALASGGHANTSAGDGQLTASSERGATSDSFVYDPLDPVPTLGGNMCCKGDLLSPGAFDQSKVEQRDDVLVYSSAPLDRNVTVIGDTTVKLWAKTSAPDTDFTAKLVDVHPDGYAQNILDRIVRASLRESSKRAPSPVVPGRAYEYLFDLGNTATMFKPGHRIRLEISSSNFPHYARNLNNGLADGPPASARRAEQTVLHDAAHQSELLVPVAPGVTPPRP
jgi:putative CocE/NonD family hydrolase